MKILVVDDEEDLCEILQFNLETEGYETDVAYSAEEALQHHLPDYDLLLLDVMMGEMSGFKMAKIVRSNPETADIPIIFLTAKDTENDVLTGFNMGADDYISKPFSLKEVLARVKAVLRRRYGRDNRGNQENTVLSHERLQLHVGNKKVLLDGQEIPFTKKEFEMLKLFLENKNRVFSRDEILSHVWTDEVCVLDRTVDVNITRLRKKIGPYGKNIGTRLGYGYTFEA